MSLPSYRLGKSLTASVLNMSKVHLTWWFPIPWCDSRLPYQEAWSTTAKMFISTLHSLQTKPPLTLRNLGMAILLGLVSSFSVVCSCWSWMYFMSWELWLHESTEQLAFGRKCNRCKQYKELSHASLSPRSHILIEKTHSKNMTLPQQFPMVFQHFSSWLGLWLGLWFGSRAICRTEPNPCAKMKAAGTLQELENMGLPKGKRAWLNKRHARFGKQKTRIVKVTTNFNMRRMMRMMATFLQSSKLPRVFSGSKAP